jgi:thiol-disulfide isomerase/thioredoxin
MKKILLTLAFLAALTGATAQDNQPAVTVYYFHGAYRCPTCRAIESNSKATVEKYFAAELKSGKVKFQTVDVSLEANLKIAEKYEASGSALWVTKVAGGKETRNDLTDFAFSNVRSDPGKFEDGLKNKIEESLKP